jgi:hypothetical protein
LIANKYCSRRGWSDYLSFVGRTWPSGRTRDQPAKTDRRTPIKKIVLAVALVLAFAAPAVAGQFPNLYATNADARSH